MTKHLLITYGTLELYVATFSIITSQSLSSVKTANREVYLQRIVSTSTDTTRWNANMPVLGSAVPFGRSSGIQCCQMLVEKPAWCPHKTSPKPAKKRQTRPNYSPKCAMTLTVCSENDHHYLLAVAVFVQRTTDLSYKATSNTQNNK